MRRYFALMLLLTGLMTAMKAQTVDSIRIEQAGDFIKVYYKILGSETDQTYRISIMAAINGGLRSELRSVSGDIGENIVGGKDEYWIIWDVLKDVEELNSVEFFVKAELTKDMSPQTGNAKTKQGQPTGWEKKRFSIMPIASFPGPRLGLMLGFNGSLGVTAYAAHGKIVEDVDIAISPVSGSIDFDDDEGGLQFGISITKRLVSYDSFQLHLAAGFSVAEMSYIDTDNSDFNLDFEVVVTQGLSAGMMLSAGRLSAALLYQHYDPGSVERQGDYYLVSRMNLITLGIGVRF